VLHATVAGKAVNAPPARASWPTTACSWRPAKLVRRFAAFLDKSKLSAGLIGR